MKRILFMLVIAFVFISCGNSMKNIEKQFYLDLDSVKSNLVGKNITINKNKFSETSDPLGSIYLFTNADKDNLAGEVRFSTTAKYKLSYGQITSLEYENNDFSKNLMVQVESDNDNLVYQNGWISIENIEEFRDIVIRIK